MKPPTTRKCVRCGAAFAPSRGNHVACSERCRRREKEYRRRERLRKLNHVCASLAAYEQEQDVPS